MTGTNAVEDNKAFVAAILALEAQIKTTEDAVFVAEHFSALRAAYTILSDRYNSRKRISSPSLNDPLPPEIKALVGEYEAANKFVTEKLIEHGGFDFAYEEVDSGKGQTTWRIRSLIYKDRENNDQAMAVHRKYAEKYDGMSASTLYIFGNQYMDLLRSMLKRGHIPCDARKDILRQVLKQLDIAIAARKAVHDWHKRLPEADARIKKNASHADFLSKLEALREAVDSSIATGTSMTRSNSL